MKEFNIESVDEPASLRDVAWSLASNANIASKRWVYEQYDTMVGTRNMTTNFPCDAGLVNIKGSRSALALTVDCNSRYVYADPDIGTQIAVSEAARNITCSGADPLAITNCLNFGNPYNPEVYWQFVGAIKGMSKACKKFGTPVTGGNVSFYNQTSIGNEVVPVYPTPTIGMLGVVKEKNNQMSMAFKGKGSMIYLIGKSRNDISSSQYLVSWHGIEKSPVPYFNLEEEFRMQTVLRELISYSLVRSAHDISEGGLFISLFECGIPKCLGFDITSDAEVRRDAFLFGEAQGRVVVTVSPTRETEFIDYMLKQDVPFSALGHVTRGEMRIDDMSYGFVCDMKKAYMESLESQLKE